MARTLEQIIAAEKPEIVAAASEQAKKILFNINLAEQGEPIDNAQMDLAGSLRLTQPAIAEMEPSGDSICNSGKRY
jgi:hypothetical protein